MAMESLRGRVAIVTGGSRGIGLAIARALVAEGVQVAVTGRSEAHLAAARPSIESAGPGAVETLQADVRRADEVARAIDATVARFGGLDILINNAGIGVFSSVAAMTAAQWTEVIETNLTGVFHACLAALPHLQRRGGGFIINISSLAGKNPFANGAAYCASKAQHQGQLRHARLRVDRIRRRRRVERRRLEDRTGRGGGGCRQPPSPQSAQPSESRGVAPVQTQEMIANLATK